MLEIIDHGSTRELKLNRPPVNALNPAIVSLLDHAVSGVPAAGVRMLILSGRPGLFSAGLDVPALLELDAAALSEFWAQLFRLLHTLASSEVPIVAAITGHSPAGGAVLSLFCDYRIMAEGEFKIGLNEVQVGLYVPEPIQFALRRLIGAHRAERLMVAGAMIRPAEALRIGLVDELAPTEAVVPQALAWCQRHAHLPTRAMSLTRQLARADLVAGSNAPMDAARMTEGWFGAESQQVLRKLFPGRT